MQIENEYENVEAAFAERGPSYVRWAASMAVGLGTGVPWMMCKQSDAPDPVVSHLVLWANHHAFPRIESPTFAVFGITIFQIHLQINTCNGMKCGETFLGPNSPKKPTLWTENWTQRYVCLILSPCLTPRWFLKCMIVLIHRLFVQKVMLKTSQGRILQQKS